MEAMKAEAKRARLRLDAVRAQSALPADQYEEPEPARQLRARGDQCADPGLGRRHHPPRHDPYAGCAGRDAGLEARMLLQVHDELIFEASEKRSRRHHESRARCHGGRARPSAGTQSPVAGGRPRRRQLGGRALGASRLRSYLANPSSHRVNSAWLALLVAGA